MTIRVFTIDEYADRLVRFHTSDLTLIELRQTLRASQDDIANALGISQAYVCMCERGKRDPERLRRLILKLFAKELEILHSLK